MGVRSASSALVVPLSESITTVDVRMVWGAGPSSEELGHSLGGVDLMYSRDFHGLKVIIQ